MNGDAVEAAVGLARIFESLGVRFMIGGSLASSTWGEPRFTQDVDFVVSLEARHVDLEELLRRARSEAEL